MKKASFYLTLIAVLLTILLIAIPAQGGGCHVAVRHQAVVEKVVVKEVAVVTPIVAQFVQIPLYGAVYNPLLYPAPIAAPQAAPQHKADCPDVSALRAELAALKAALGKPQAPTMPPAEVDPFAPQQQQQDSVSRILSARCASCHSDNTAKVAGKGIVLTQGGRAKAFTPEELGGIIAAVSSRSMPKGGSMTDAERVELISALTSGK